MKRSKIICTCDCEVGPPDHRLPLLEVHPAPAQYSTVQYSTVQYSTVLHRAAPVQARVLRAQPRDLEAGEAGAGHEEAVPAHAHSLTRGHAPAPPTWQRRPRRGLASGWRGGRPPHRHI